MGGLLVFVTLMLGGYLFGQHAEKKHFKSIRERESEYRDLLSFSTKLPPRLEYRTRPVLVSGCAVISIDYFKQFAAGLRTLFGGRVTSYETLIDRARREAVLRMKIEAKAQGAQLICNVRLETASITKGAQGQVGAVEVYAYGTGFVREAG